jgi:hypothetical protein
MMEKRYVMDAVLSASERIAALGLCGILVICWLCAVFSGVSHYVWLAVYNSLIFLFLAIVRLVIARDLLRTVWDVNDATVSRKSPTRIVSMEYSRIVRFRYIYVPLLFNAGMIKHESGPLFLSFYIKDLASLIADVRDGLIRSGNPDACDASNLERYVRAARMSELRNDRLRRFMTPLFSSMIIALFTSVTTSYFLWSFNIAQTFVWSVFMLLIFMLFVTGAEVLLFSLVRGKKTVQRYPRETEIYVFAGIICFSVCLWCGIWLRTALGQ